MNLFFIILALITGIIYGFLAGNSDYIDGKYIFYVSRIFYICLSLAAVRFLTHIIVENLGANQKKVPSELMRLLVAVFLYLFFSALIMKLGFNMNITTLVTTSALLTAILGLAMQTTLGNIFSGLSLQIEQLFYIGDTVRLKDILGIIESITWRSVSIRTMEGSIIVIPNSKISSTNVEVFHKEKPVQVKTNICVPISYPPQKVRNIITEVIQSVPHVDTNKAIIVNLDSIKPHDSINSYSINCFSNNFALKFPVLSTIKERVWYAFARNKIDLLNIEREKQFFIAPSFFEKVKIKSDFLPNHYLKIIFNTPIFTPLDKEEKLYIADNIEKLIFTHGESILFEKKFRNTMFIIAQGIVKVEYISDDIEDDLILIDENKTKKNSKFLWDTKILEELIDRFVPFVGPVGGHLVRQASRKTINLYSLYNILASELTDENDKEQFLKDIPTCHVKSLHSEDFFGALRLFMEIKDIPMRYEAVGHVDLIAIKPQIMKEIFQRRPSLVKDFSKIMAGHIAETIEFNNPLSEDKWSEADILDKINLFYSL